MNKLLHEINKLLNKIIYFLTKCVGFIIYYLIVFIKRIVVSTIKYTLHKIRRFVHVLWAGARHITTPYHKRTYRVFEVTVNILLFVFITIPWWFFGEFIQPKLGFVYNLIITCARNNTLLILLKKKLLFVLNNVFILLTKTKVFFKKKKKQMGRVRKYLYVQMFWKPVLDFLYCNLYRGRKRYYSIFLNVYFFSIKCLLVLLVIKSHIIIMCFNTILVLFLRDMDFSFCFIFKDYVSFLDLFLVLINPDNLFLLLYICLGVIGIQNLLFFDQGGFFLYIGAVWADYYYTFKFNKNNFSFFDFFVIDYFKSNFNKNDFFLDIGSYVFSDSNPIFFFFGFFFFLTVIFSWFFFSYIGLYGMFFLNLTSLFVFWVSLIISMKNVFFYQKVYIVKLCSWIFLSSNVKIDCYFLIDTISFSFIFLTTTIALFVYLFAFSYFKYEPLVDRFLLFILSFVVSMVFLVASGNVIMLFLGWELIGFTSFCLINFWTTKTATLKSAFKAFSFNKVSDFFFFMFILLTYTLYYTFDIVSINNQIYFFKQHTLYFFGTKINSTEILAFFLLGAAFIKSAQLGGHAWLPDSMEAPVPASSLIHSATLVSAGVYLILRFNFIFDSTELAKLIIPVVGSITACYGGVCAVAQSDIKKTLAYSTISHCGFLMVCCAIEMNEFTILYLYVHGFFKAGVFMCVGNVLRVTKGYQDTRRMGGLLKYLPFEYYCATVGVLNLAGLPFTLGFVIKHLLLISLDNHLYLYYFVVFNCLIGAFAGVFYSYRLVTYTFNDFKKADKSTYLQLNRKLFNSTFYSNTSLAPTLAIFYLFISAYFIVGTLFFYFLKSTGKFSDYMNTTTITNYFSMVETTSGYLLNFSYMNIVVICIVLYLIFSRFKKTPMHYKLLNVQCVFLLLSLFSFIFYNFL